MNKKINKKKSRKRLFIRGKGSLLIGVMIVFLMISAIALAIISRTIQGIQLTNDSKKGYTTYQQSDQTVEGFLSKLNDLDSGPDAGYADNQIPENTLATSFCSGVKCLKSDGTTTPAGTDKVTTIFNSQADVTNQGITRSVYAPVSDRVDGKLTAANSMTAKQCGVAGSPAACNGSRNKCDIVVTADKALEPDVINYEIRKSSGDNDDGSLENGAGDFANHYGWVRVEQNPGVNPYFIRNNTRLIKNGDSKLGGTPSIGGQYGETYYFTIKARNKNPFKLDSLYLSDNATPPHAVKSVTLGSTECSGGLSTLGCTNAPLDAIPGTMLRAAPYNCCNGSECYDCKTGWNARSGTWCAQGCASSTEGWVYDVKRNPVVNDAPAVPTLVGGKDDDGIAGGVGYCKNAMSCDTSGETQATPYRKVAWCEDCPDPSYVLPADKGIKPSTWRKSNLQDVDMNGGQIWVPLPLPGHYEANPAYILERHRCCKHDCPSAPIVQNPLDYCGAKPTGAAATPWDTSGTSCAPRKCGYELTKSCILRCLPGWSVGGSAPSGYNGTCCIPDSCASGCRVCGGCASPCICPVGATGCTNGNCSHLGCYWS